MGKKKEDAAEMIKHYLIESATPGRTYHDRPSRLIYQLILDYIKLYLSVKEFPYSNFEAPYFNFVNSKKNKDEAAIDFIEAISSLSKDNAKPEKPVLKKTKQVQDKKQKHKKTTLSIVDREGKIKYTCPPCLFKQIYKKFELSQKSDQELAIDFTLSSRWQILSEQKLKETLKSVMNSIKDIDIADLEIKAYHNELYNLFRQTKWNHLNPWEKFKFFKLWFIAISEEYMKAYIAYEKLHRRYEIKAAYEQAIHNRKIDKKDSPLLKALGSSVEWIRFDDDASQFYFHSFKAFGFPVDIAWRSEYLKEKWSKKGLKRYEQLGFSNPKIVWQTTPEKVAKLYNVAEPYLNEVVSELKTSTFEFDERSPVRLFYVNVQYPKDEILKKLKKIVEERQKIYFSKHPGKKAIFVKQDIDGRKDTYPFEAWARYLKIYMLKQQKIINREIGKQFFPRDNYPIRRVNTDKAKAENLSKNALSDNFPGEY